MEFITSGPIASFEASILWLAVLFIAARFGRSVFIICGIQSAALTALELRLFSVGLGLTLISLGILSLGLCGQLTAAAAGIFLMAILALSFFKVPIRSHFSLRSLFPKFEDLRAKLMFSFVVWVFLMAWVQAMAPPIGTDALAYHLFYPKEFISHHKIYYVPDGRESLWPFQTEMLFLLGLLIQGTSLAQAVHYSFFILTAMAIYAFALRFFNTFTAMVAALIFVLCPAAFAQSGYAYVDLVLAFYIFMALYAFALIDRMPEHHAAILSAFSMAGAVSTKYLGLSAAVVLCLFWVVRSKDRLNTTGLWILGVSVLSGVWYLRSFWVIGNPVYPFFSKLFGSGLDFDIGAGGGMGKRLVNFLKFPWNLTMYPGNFGGESVGPLYLLFIPMALFQLRSVSKRTVYLIIFTAAYTFLLFKQSQHARFYLSVVPLLSVAAAAVFSACLVRGACLKKISIVCLSGILLLHGGIYVYRLRNCWQVVLGCQDAGSYLTRFERSFPGYLYFKEHAKPEDRIFNSAEVRAFYNTSPNMTFDSIFFRKSIEKKRKTLEGFLDHSQFEYIWLRDDSDPELLRYVRGKGYLMIFDYTAVERPAAFHYLIFRANR